MNEIGAAQSPFVVCRTCHRYFHEKEIEAHQKAQQHFDVENFQKWYHLMNSEVTFYLNRRVEIQETIQKLRFLV